MSRKLRTVFDTNAWASGIAHPGSLSRELLNLWEAGVFELLTSREIIMELMDVLREHFNFSDDLAYYWHTKIFAQSTVIEPVSRISICRDADDDKFLICAIDGKANYIVSNDNDLLALKEIEGIPIIKRGEFYNILMKWLVNQHRTFCFSF